MERRIVTWTRARTLAALLAACASAAGCRAPAPRPLGADPSIRFADLVPGCGITYRWPEQPRPLDIRESFGAGCAFLDYDDDGLQDVLLVATPTPLLYRNRGQCRFEEVTTRTGLNHVRGDWRGCAAADYDGDGAVDLLLTGYRRLALLRNVGERWEETTKAAGLDPMNRRNWGSSAGFMDLDRDGDLDLVLLNYVHFQAGSPRYCQWKLTVRSGCGPAAYPPAFPELWRNEGNARFSEVTDSSGLRSSHGKGLVLAFHDVDEDGRVDLYIGNDGRPADLLMNHGGLKFREEAEQRGAAYGSVGPDPISAMGADWSDFDRDGRLDLVVSAFSNEPYSLLRARGEGGFEHVGDRVGLSTLTYKPLGFGARWVDMDNDGWPDLAFANGHVHHNTAEIDATTSFKQPLMLLRNRGATQLEDAAPRMGPQVWKPILGRGLASGDIDNDGRVDLLVVDYEGTPLLLHNRTHPGHHWLTLDLRGRAPNSHAYGARVTARAGSRTWVAEVSPAASYLSTNDPRIHFGLGEVRRLEMLTVDWPSGRRERWSDVAADQVLRLTEGAIRIHASVPSTAESSPAASAPLIGTVADAIRSDDLVRLRRLVRGNSDANGTDLHGTPFLVLAAQRGNEATLRLLLERGARTEVTDAEGGTPFLRAALGGHVAVLKALRKHGAAVDPVDRQGSTPLLWACSLRRPALARQLIAMGADLQARNRLGHTPLIATIASGKTSTARSKGLEAEEAALVRDLLAKGARVDAADPDGRTPAIWAAYQGRGALLELLLRAGAPVNARDHTGRTALMWSVLRRDTRAMTALLVAGGDPDLRDGKGDTPLIWAALVADPEPTRLLLAHQANPKVRDGGGKTPLLIAASAGNTRTLSVLLKSGADLEARDRGGMTALSWSAALGRLEAIRLLLRAGARVETADHQGRSPLILAANAGRTAAVRRLLQAGARVDGKAANGGTALMWATASGHAPVVRVLLAAGASPRLRAPDGETALSLAQHGPLSAHREIARLLQSASRRGR